MPVWICVILRGAARLGLDGAAGDGMGGEGDGRKAVSGGGERGEVEHSRVARDGMGSLEQLLTPSLVLRSERLTSLPPSAPCSPGLCLCSGPPLPLLWWSAGLAEGLQASEASAR